MTMPTQRVHKGKQHLSWAFAHDNAPDIVDGYEELLQGVREARTGKDLKDVLTQTSAHPHSAVILRMAWPEDLSRRNREDDSRDQIGLAAANIPLMGHVSSTPRLQLAHELKQIVQAGLCRPVDGAVLPIHGFWGQGWTEIKNSASYLAYRPGCERF